MTIKPLSAGLLRAISVVWSLPHILGRPLTRTAYVPQIDGLRCLAIMIVMFWHSALRAVRHLREVNAGSVHATQLPFPIPHGDIGVSLFFFISGVVIAQPFMSKPIALRDVLPFYRRRARRIYPPYIIMLTVMFIALAVLHVSAGDATTMNDPKESKISLTSSFVASAVYMHGLWFDASPKLDPPFWSLEIEIQFYLLSPLLLWLYLLPASRTRRCFIGIVVTLGLIILASNLNLAHWGGPFHGIYRFGLITHLYLFVAGILAADLDKRNTASVLPAKVYPRYLYDFYLLAGCCGMILCGLWLAKTDGHPHLGWPRLFETCLGLTSIAGVYAGAIKGGLGRTIFGQPWVSFIGTFCYSLYLTHIAVMQSLAGIMFKILPLRTPLYVTFMTFVVLIPAAIALGLIYYILIERPFMTSNMLQAYRGLFHWRTDP